MNYYRLMDLSELLKALADPNRLRILNLLQGRTLCVCDLEAVLGLNQSNLSRHLAKLKQTGLVTCQKKGLFMYYSCKAIPSPYDKFVEVLYATLAEATQDGDPRWRADRQALLARPGCV